ncbi:MAG: hypothetical protein JRJ27_20045 [Deltaproteobacteria bacterium]|nr:hypothetical protein [Deltaproteobacteria bacterium]
MDKKVKIIILYKITFLAIFVIVFGKTFIGNTVSGRVHFPKEYVDKTLVMENGQKFTIFRTLTVNSKTPGTTGFAVFKVRFKFSGLKPEDNKRLSMIPVPFLVGMKGFRAKYWMINEDTGYFQGVYQWTSKEIAENYPDSFIFQLMTKRAASGTVSYEVLPDTDISDYIKYRFPK